MWFLWFLWWWSLRRGQLNKSPCRCKKKYYKIQKKLPNSIKLDLLSCTLIPLIVIKRYTRSIIFMTFCQKLSNSWKTNLEVHWRCLQIIALQNQKKKKIPISLKYVLDSFPFTPYVFIKRYTWSINFEKIH